MENNKENNKKNNKYMIVGAIVSIVVIILAGVTSYLMLSKNKTDDNKIPYTDLIKQITDGEIEKIEMTVGSTSLKVKVKGIEEEKTSIVPNTQAFIELVQEKVSEGNNIELIQNPQPVILKISQTLFSLLPTLVIVALFIMIFKMQGLGEKGKVYDAETSKEKIKFDDVAGLDEEKQEMIEIVQFLKEPEKFTKMGAKVPKGVLLYGKPGTGKTLIAKAIAGEAGVPFISMSGSEFIEMFAGLGASRVRKLFEKARKVAPCIVFIDEIDAITINVPDKRGREEILKIHSKGKNFAENVKLKTIAEDTAGLTGAELANILNESAILATVNEHEVIQQEDIEEAFKKVTIGLQKTSRVYSEKDKKLTAYHEAGHAIVSRYLETQEPVKEISIIPRGMAGGYTMNKTNEDKNYISKTEMEERLIVLKIW